MRQLCYGVWDDQVYDNRNSLEHKVPPNLDLRQLYQFNNGNPVMVFISHRGFLVFEQKANLLKAFHSYYCRVRDESCGRCTPCRSGSNIIAKALDEAVSGQFDKVDWNEVLEVARMMRNTSFCGIGQTSPTALVEAIKHFPEELKKSDGLKSNSCGLYSMVTAPCIEACPAKVNVPRYIDYIRDGAPELATGVVLKHYPLVGSCGRVCVRFCEHACRRTKLEDAVDIKNLKRYASDKLSARMDSLFKNAYQKPADFAPRIAVVGAGPAGIVCAYHLLLKGYQVEIFEAQRKAGGMALVGIPPYRLPKGLLQTETGVIDSLGGKFHFNKKLGRDFSIDDLFNEGFNAIFLGVGCPTGMKLGFPEDTMPIKGYSNGLDFLLKVERSVDEDRPVNLEGDFVVVGGGNVAMDCCRSAVRLTNGKVHVVYRRNEKNAPADPAEIHAAKEEGIEFHFLTAQKELVIENDQVVGLKCVKLKMEEVPGGGRGKLTEIPGTEFVIPCTHVISAIGQRIDQSIFSENDGILFDRRGNISVTASLATSRPAVFAGGDCATGPTTLVGGMGQGQLAAESIHEYLTRGSVGFEPRIRMSQLIQKLDLMQDLNDVLPVRHMPRSKINELPPEERIHNFREVELGFTDEQAQYEAERCMRCYRIFSVMTQLPIPGTDEEKKGDK